MSVILWRVTCIEISPPSVRIPLSQRSDTQGPDDCTQGRPYVHDALYHCVHSVSKVRRASIDSRGLHFLGKISAGMAYPRGREQKPRPMSTCAAMSLFMLWDPGAIPQPMRAEAHRTSSKVFRAWNLSEMLQMTGPRIACGSTYAWGNHTCSLVLLRSCPIYES